MKHFLFLFSLVVLCVCATSCSKQATIPSSFETTDAEVSILPDYRNVTIPPNIAPLNFSVLGDSVEESVACFKYNNVSLVYSNEHKVLIPMDEWRSLLNEAKGDSITVSVYTRQGNVWRRYQSFSIFVANDSIDPYIAYRLIPPYNTYERMSLNYRSLETFDEHEFYNNQMLDAPKGGQCMNCHSFQNYRSERMQFHVREEFGGTIIVNNGSIRKVPLKSDKTIGAGVYPHWHPSLPIVAYSTNKPFLEFHTNGLAKSEVQDSECALIFYDADNNSIISIESDSLMMETFPAWSPDGKWLYYCAARFEFVEKESGAKSTQIRLRRQHEVNDNYRSIKYDIYRRPFDAETMTVGKSELVINASSDSLSAVLPRISPDGRWLLTGVSEYGGFHIYHPDADLYLTNLYQPADSGAYRYTRLSEACSPTSADSYHSWSSNSRWIIFQSRRRDDNYTRLYISYISEDGRSHKAFELPQSDPDYELIHLRSYNIPEFLKEPVRYSPADFARVVMP